MRQSLRGTKQKREWGGGRDLAPKRVGPTDSPVVVLPLSIRTLPRVTLRKATSLARSRPVSSGAVALRAGRVCPRPSWTLGGLLYVTVSALRDRSRNAGDAGADSDGVSGSFESGTSSCFWVGGDGLSWSLGDGGCWRCGLWRLVRGKGTGGGESSAAVVEEDNGGCCW